MNDFIERNRPQIQQLLTKWVKEMRDEAVTTERGEERDYKLDLANKLEEFSQTLDPKQTGQKAEKFI